MIYVEKQCLAGVESLVHLPAYQMDNRKVLSIKGTDAAAPQKVPLDISALGMIKALLTQEEIILAQTGNTRSISLSESLSMA